MSCDVWEKKGLLYSSKELLDDEIKEFEEHIKNCRECSEEWESYISSKRFFIPEIFEEYPSEECDKKILRVCGDGRKKIVYLQPPFFSLVLRRTFISVGVFLFGFIIFGLISLQIDTIKKDRKIASTVNSARLITVTDSNRIELDSSSDTSNLQPENKVGDIKKTGVYPVDLKNR